MKTNNAIQEAQDAFWAVIAKHHPECKTGDLDPMSVLAFDNACNRVVNTWVDGNKPNSAGQKEGRLLEIEPEIDAIAETHWDCWADDGYCENPRYEWDDQRSIAITYALLIQWAKRLGIPDFHPWDIIKRSGMGERMINDFEHFYLTGGQHPEGYANVFRIVIDEIIEAGYSVYVSDTRLKIYRTEDL